jgi:hypothetical protein
MLNNQNTGACAEGSLTQSARKFVSVIRSQEWKGSPSVLAYRQLNESTSIAFDETLPEAVTLRPSLHAWPGLLLTVRLSTPHPPS